VTRIRTNAADPARVGRGRRQNAPVQMAVRGTRLVGVLVVPLACVLAVPLAAWLDVQAPGSGPGQDVAEGIGWPWTMIGALIGTFAAVVLVREPRQKFGWVLAFSGLFWALDGLGQSYLRAGLTETSAWPAMTAVLWFYNRFGSYLTSVTAASLLAFPTGRFLPGRWRTASWAAVVAMLASGVAFIVVPADGDRAVAHLPPGVDPDPTTIDALASHSGLVAGTGLALGISGFFFSLLTVVVRYRRSQGLERDRMRWLLWSAVVIVIAVGAGAGLSLPYADFVGIFSATVLPPAAMTIAIVRPALVPIQDLLGRTVVLAAVFGALLLADAAVLGLLTLVLDDALTQAQVVGVVLAVAVLLYGPLRQRLSNGVRRLMVGERGDRYDAVAGLASTLETTDDTDEQLAAVARSVATAFGVRFVSVEVDRSHGERSVTTYGERPDRVRTLPITYRGVGVGRLVLPDRGLRSRLSAADERLLGDLVRQAATAARTSQLADEVQQSRERLVTAREEERRRIRRDLHDGFGPALSGVVFQLEAARMLVERDPAAAVTQLEDVSAHVQDVVADVRRLVHDLRPPALDDRGLVGALRQQAERLELPLTVVADDVERADGLSAAVEVAAYRIVGEAFTNIVRHARATRATLGLAVAGDSLRVEVADDGVGISPDRQAGVGLVGLRERAAELGGTSEIFCPPDGGTVVRAVLPLRST
jgi:signal transduction histidine kinase